LIVKALAVAVAAVTTLVVAPAAPGAATLSVPGQFPSIQAAINAATDGDTVSVSPGTYAERIDFGTKDLTVESTGGAAATIIDGGSLGSVVVMNAQAGESPTLRGFTVRNGRALFDDGYTGGGVRTTGGPAVIEDNVITANATCDSGGGISARFSQAIIRGNRITGNFQSGCSGGAGGGGVLIGGDGSVTLVDNVIVNNSHGSWGSGVSLFAAGTPTIARNVIRNNSGALGGGGFWIVNHSDAQIEDNLIVGNSADQGAGVYLSVPSGERGAVLVNNTVVANVGSIGTALYSVGFDGTARVANNILSGGGTSVVYCDPSYDQNPPVIEFNDVVQTEGGARYGGICADLTGSNGNVSLAPAFVDAPAGDYHLSPASALIDSGTNVGVPAVDLDGELRTVDGNGDGVPVTDIGADETSSGVDTTPPVLTVPGPLTVNATSPQGAAVTFSATATDNADPTPTVTCVPASGSVFAIGTTTVGCTARDDSGNTTSGSFTVTVLGAADQIAALRAQVALLPDEKLGRSLDGKLRDAANALAAGQIARACSRLAAFVAEVQVHSGEKIPAPTASAWVADATRIRAVIGC
jgi:nitrous oxidase accessory protein NosD